MKCKFEGARFQSKERATKFVAFDSPCESVSFALEVDFDGAEGLLKMSSSSGSEPLKWSQRTREVPKTQFSIFGLQHVTLLTGLHPHIVVQYRKSVPSLLHDHRLYF